MARFGELKESRLVASVQTGPSRFIFEGYTATGICYRVEADVIPYWGVLPKPGAVWTFIRGIAPSHEGLDAVRERVLSTYTGNNIYRFEGSRRNYPYQENQTPEVVL